MRVILLILAAYAFAAWNDAQAACQKFKPDGTVEECQHMAPGAAPITPGPNQASANKCQIGGLRDRGLYRRPAAGDRNAAAGPWRRL